MLLFSSRVSSLLLKTGNIKKSCKNGELELGDTMGAQWVGDVEISRNVTAQHDWDTLNESIDTVVASCHKSQRRVPREYICLLENTLKDILKFRLFSFSFCERYRE